MFNYSIIPFYVNSAIDNDSGLHSKKNNRKKYFETTLLKLYSITDKVLVGVQNDSDIELVKNIIKSIDIDNVEVLRIECEPYDLPIELCKGIKTLNLKPDDIIFYNEADQFLTSTIVTNQLCNILKQQKDIIFAPHRIEKLYDKKYGKWLTGFRPVTFDTEERLPFEYFGEQCYYPNTYKRYLKPEYNFYKSPDIIEAYAAAWLTTFATYTKIPFEKYTNAKCLEGPSFATITDGLSVLKTTSSLFSIIHLGAYEYNAQVVNINLTVEEIIEHHRKFLYNDTVKELVTLSIESIYK